MVTRWRVFAWLFAVTEVTRSLQIHEWIWERNPLGGLMLLSGLALAFRPHSARLFLVTAGVRLTLFLSRLPDVHNQEMIETLLLSGVLLGWALARPSNDEERFAAAAPVLRAGVVAVYGIAVFQKLNVDFFDPEVGCAATLWRTSVARWGLPAGWANFGMAATWGTLIVETSLPVLLILRRSRALALVGALGFHWWLAVDMGVYAFSAMMFAWLSAFTPSTWLTVWRQEWSPLRLLGGAALGTGAVASVWVWLTAGPRLGVLGWVWWDLMAALIMAAAATAAWYTRGADAEPAFAKGASTVSAWTVVALAVLNASSPYVGLKTMSSITMYSNLATEGHHWNHWLVPRNVKVFGYQDDLLRIDGSDQPRLRAAAERGALLPRFEVRRQLRLDGEPVWVEYRDGDRSYRLERDGDRLVDPQGLLDGGSWFQEKVLHFNLVPPGDKQPCRFDRPHRRSARPTTN